MTTRKQRAPPQTLVSCPALVLSHVQTSICWRGLLVEMASVCYESRSRRGAQEPEGLAPHEWLRPLLIFRGFVYRGTAPFEEIAYIERTVCHHWGLISTISCQERRTMAFGHQRQLYGVCRISKPSNVTLRVQKSRSNTTAAQAGIPAYSLDRAGEIHLERIRLSNSMTREHTSSCVARQLAFLSVELAGRSGSAGPGWMSAYVCAAACCCR